MIDQLSIIIPTLNEEKYLPKLLKSIAEQDFKGKLQVIVVDGQSQDKTTLEAEKFKNIIHDLEILRTERDIGRQRNRGAEKAEYNHLLFLDADVILPKKCLSSLADKINPNERLVASVLHKSTEFDLLDVIFIYICYLLFFLAWLGGTPVTPGDFILTTKDNHKKINGFKEGAILGEDTDYGIRSVKDGAKYHFYLHTYILGSPRRVRNTGRLILFLTWAKSFLYVRKHGPIYDENFLKYSFIQH